MSNALKDYSWLLSVALLAVLGVGCSSVEEKPAPTPPASSGETGARSGPGSRAGEIRVCKGVAKPRRLKSKA